MTPNLECKQETSDDYRKQLEEAEARAASAEATAAAEKEQCQRMLEAAAGGPRGAAASPASALPVPVCRVGCACADAGTLPTCPICQAMAAARVCRANKCHCLFVSDPN